MSVYVRAPAVGLVACRTCGKVVKRLPASAQRCPRCGFRMDLVASHSTAAALAWLITAVLLYLPANLLPVMHTGGIFGAEDSTIFGGIVTFLQSGSVGIAALIFVASVAVPITKFMSIGLLLFTVHNRSRWASRQRAKLYRAVEFIGYWSMLDVIVVAITSSLLQFKALGTAEPRAGIAYFCAVVVATMLSARCFDAQLIWGHDLDRGRQ